LNSVPPMLLTVNMIPRETPYSENLTFVDQNIDGNVRTGHHAQPKMEPPKYRRGRPSGDGKQRYANASISPAVRCQNPYRFVRSRIQ
jgi:hypothetical protein